MWMLQSGKPIGFRKSCNQSILMGQFFLAGTPKSIHRIIWIFGGCLLEQPNERHAIIAVLVFPSIMIISTKRYVKLDKVC